MKKLVHVLLLGVALLGSVASAFADGTAPIPTKPPTMQAKPPAGVGQ